MWLFAFLDYDYTTHMRGVNKEKQIYSFHFGNKKGDARIPRTPPAKEKVPCGTWPPI